VNPLIQAAQEAATQGWLLGFMTIFFMVFFVGYSLWAWWPSNKGHMEDMAQLPLDDDAPTGATVLLKNGGRR